LSSHMFPVVFNEAKFELSLEEVPHAVHGTLGDKALKLDLFPKKCWLTSSFVGLCNLINFESLG
jgi:hypothetical protein